MPGPYSSPSPGLKLPLVNQQKNAAGPLLKPENPIPTFFAAQAIWLCTGQVRPSGGPPACRSNLEDMPMRTFDLAPLYRSTVGFDRLFSMLDQAGGVEGTPGYPPYNIERTGENDYRISIAVAGFGPDELSIEAKENTLTVRGEKHDKQDKSAE